MGNPKFNFIYIKELLKDLKDELVNEGTFYFLSRPRRFGKSLFVDTL